MVWKYSKIITSRKYQTIGFKIERLAYECLLVLTLLVNHYFDKEVLMSKYNLTYLIHL